MTGPSETGLVRPYAVVLFGADQSDDEHRPCDLSHCPMEVHLFGTDRAARAFMDAAPAWTQPHFLRPEDHTTESAPAGAPT